MRDIYLRAKGRTVIWRGDMLDLIYHNTQNVHIQCERIERERGTKMQSLLSWANAKALDVIFIQEHNLGVGRHKRWRDLCRRFGFCVIQHGVHALKNDRAVRAQRGATAMLLRMSTFDLTENDSETQESFEDRITCRKVVWQDMILPLVSMYLCTGSPGGP